MYAENRSLFFTCLFCFLIFRCYSPVPIFNCEIKRHNLLQSSPVLPSLSSFEWCSITNIRATYNHCFKWQPRLPLHSVITGKMYPEWKFTVDYFRVSEEVASASSQSYCLLSIDEEQKQGLGMEQALVPKSPKHQISVFTRTVYC